MSYLVMLGGLLILVQGALDVANVVPMAPPDPIVSMINAVGGYAVVGAISIVGGLGTMYGGWMIQQKKRKNGSLLAILFSIVGFAGGGGFIIGTVLGVLGGLMNFRVIDE